MAALLVFFSFLLLPGRAGALWPFGREKGPYLVKVGDEVITSEEFVEALKRLHTSNRVGELLAEEKEFAKENFKKYLDELINNKLMVMEAERLGLDEDRAFTASMSNYELNLFLSLLRRDEITNKVVVDDAEVEEALRSMQDKKKEAQKDDMPKPGSHRWEMVRRDLSRKKINEREKEYFDELRRRARIRIKEDLLKTISPDADDLNETVVATVDGEPVYAIEVFGRFKKGREVSEDDRRRMLDTVILHRLLDREALSRGYEDEPGIKEQIERYREKRLIDLFKRRIILPLVRVGEEEISQYYRDNKDKFKEPDSYKLKMIYVKSEDEAKAIVKELGRGADFGYLAKERSESSSKERRGDIGWITGDRIPEEVREALKHASDGDVLGPFKWGYGYAVFKLDGIRKGTVKPLEKVKTEIDKKLGRRKFNAMLEKYLLRLRETVPIDINEEELSKFTGGA